MSSRRPTKGDTMVAPAFAAASACMALKISVQLVATSWAEKMRMAFSPSIVIGTLTTMFEAIFTHSSPSRTMPPVSVLMAMGDKAAGARSSAGDDDALPGLEGGDIWAALAKRYETDPVGEKRKRDDEEEEQGDAE